MFIFIEHFVVIARTVTLTEAEVAAPGDQATEEEARTVRAVDSAGITGEMIAVVAGMAVSS